MNTQLLLTSISIDELKNIVSESVLSALKAMPVAEPVQDKQQLITEAELSARLHRSKVTLNDWRKKGLLPFYRIARKIYYNWDEVLHALKRIERRPV